MTAMAQYRQLLRAPLVRSTKSIIKRSISSSPSLNWDQVQSQTHPSKSPATFIKHPKTVSIIGAPMTHGQPLLGTDDGPDMLRDGGLHALIRDLEWNVEETGNLTFAPPTPNDPVLDPSLGLAKQSFAVGNGLALLRDQVALKRSEEKFCLVLGGDHTIGAGSLAGVLDSDPNTGCIWVDAHADINTPEVSPSGNMHGMPLSFLIKDLVDTSRIPGFEWMANVPKINPKNQLVYVGLRDVDAGERVLIRDLGIKAFSMQEVDKYGIGKVMEMALDHLNGADGTRPIHMSYDIDAVDPVDAPSTGTRVRGGLTWREANYVAEAVAETGVLASLDMVEVNPSLAPGQGAKVTVEMALGLIASCLGNRIL